MPSISPCSKIVGVGVGIGVGDGVAIGAGVGIGEGAAVGVSVCTFNFSADSFEISVDGLELEQAKAHEIRITIWAEVSSVFVGSNGLRIFGELKCIDGW